MKKFTILIVVFFALAVHSQSGDFYYTFNNKKSYLNKVPDKFLVEFPYGITNNIGYPGSKINENTYVVTSLGNLSDYSSNYYVNPVYTTTDGLELKYRNEILLKFKNTVSTAQKTELIDKYELKLKKHTKVYEMYIAKSDALPLSRVIYLSGLVEFCTPDFLAKLEPLDIIPGDEFFSRQWYLHNTGQGSNDGHSTTVDADIDAPEAWEITLGSADVTVAVIDEGVTNDHPDLPNERQVIVPGSNFSVGYDLPNDLNDPSPTFADGKPHNHGNGCAGIIAASHNHEGIAGIAPKCNIMPVKISYKQDFPASSLADAIIFAADNGADIISCSWGYASTDPYLHPVMVSAIQYATGLDRILTVSAGNSAVW
ncbi:MAG TPA: S8 family serine peptidase, partial [Flavobacterium sp.]|nr:S8 family serine peptidase [Flavobacterium sp.]